MTFRSSSRFWAVTVMLAVLIDGLSYSWRYTAVPISILDVYDEYVNNHQPLLPIIFGPIFTIMASYFIANLFFK